MINSNGIFYNIINKDKTRPLIHSTNKIIGIPRYMLSLPKGRLWQSFLSFLGCTILLSPETNILIMNDGFELCGDNAPIAAAAAAGQIRSLSNKVDYVIIPRYIGFEYAPAPALNNEILPFNIRELVISEKALDITDSAMQKNLTLASLFSGYPVAETASLLQKYLSDFEKKCDEKKLPPPFINEDSIIISGEPLLLRDSFLNKNTINKIKYNYKNVFVCPIDILTEIIGSPPRKLKGIIMLFSEDRKFEGTETGITPVLTLFIERHTNENELFDEVNKFLG